MYYKLGQTPLISYFTHSSTVLNPKFFFKFNSKIIFYFFYFTENDCAWCRRSLQPNSTEILGPPEGPRYCSESCFSQSRRASFKRAKTCDWCRHIRHAVSYVDFQDGASQLQFCSDKCLNQYKMQLFCKETQAHLDMNPHLKEKGKISSGSLITPELWLKNCRSRSNSPNSERSHSLSPVPLTVSTPTPPPPSQQPKPLITVAPASKLMSRPVNLTPPKQSRKRRSPRIHHHQIINNNNNNNNNCTPNHNNNSKPCTVTSAQDLRINQHPVIDRSNFQNQYLSQTNFLRPPIMHGQQPPRFIHQQQPQQHHPMMSSEPPRLPPFGGGGSVPPPVTILVPYPIILPIPIPIPIPVPMSEYLKLKNKYSQPVRVTETPPENVPEPEPEPDEKVDEIEIIEGPLDFTKSKEATVSLKDDSPSPTPESPAHHQIEEMSLKISSVHSVCDDDLANQEQKLPKFKITRLHSKRIVSTVAPTIKESECSRPLRKRRRAFEESQNQK